MNMSEQFKQSEYREYYHNNPYELPEMDLDEYEEALDEEIVEYMDNLPANDFIDFAYSYDFEAAGEVIKRMAIAQYNGDEKDLLVFAKSFADMMVKQISDYVEKEKM